MIEIRIIAIWWIKYLCALESHSLLRTVIRILTESLHLTLLCADVSQWRWEGVDNWSSGGRSDRTLLGDKMSTAELRRQLHQRSPSPVCDVRRAHQLRFTGRFASLPVLNQTILNFSFFSVKVRFLCVIIHYKFCTWKFCLMPRCCRFL